MYSYAGLKFPRAGIDGAFWIKENRHAVFQNIIFQGWDGVKDDRVKNLSQKKSLQWKIRDKNSAIGWLIMNTTLLKTVMRFCTIAGVERIFVIVYSCMDLEINQWVGVLLENLGLMLNIQWQMYSPGRGTLKFSWHDFKLCGILQLFYVLFALPDACRWLGPP